MSSLTGQGGYGGVAGPTGKVGNKLPSGSRVGQYANYTPQQMELHQRGFEQVAPDSYLSRLAGGDQSLFNEIESPALQQHAALQGNLASRFSGGSGRGSLGTRRGSSFQNESSSAASNFAQQLQAQRQGLQRQAMMDLRSMSQQLLGERPYEQFRYEKQKKGALGGWGGVGGAVLGGIGGAFLGNPVMGAQLGYGLGSAIDQPSGGGGGGGGGMNSSSLSGLDDRYGNFVANYMPGSVI